MKRRWVLTVWTGDELFCEGVFDSYYEAVGQMMSKIWEFSDSYTKEGDEFEIGIPTISDTDGLSERLVVKYKSCNWEKGDCEIWNILCLDEADQTEPSTDCGWK